MARRVSWAIDQFCRNAVGPPEWESRPWVLWCGYNVLTSAECVFNLLIVTPADMGPVRSWSHYESTVIMIT